ncbi:MAG: hypothetical protein K2X48_14600 [Chitinophagaceae bacterium]|nr:hypothetical protein [Chitinophagaceae bacterium]
MQKNIYKPPLIFCFILVQLLIGCKTNYTQFYEDEQNSGLSIFSNQNFNVASCYINNIPWRTADRVKGGFSRTSISYEVYISKEQSPSSKDTLSVRWDGYDNTSTPVRYIRFAIPVAKDFTYRSLNLLSGQRVVIDGTNSYFEINSGSGKGKGVIYFHQLKLDSLPNIGYTGKMSGLFEAQIPGFTITKGRFDHLLESGFMFRL